MRTLLKNIVHAYQRPNSQKWIAICLIFCFTLSFLFGNTTLAGASVDAAADTDSVSASDTVSDATVSDSASDQTEDSVSSNPSDTSSEDSSDITSDDSSSDSSDTSADTTTDKDSNDTSGNASNNTEDANQDPTSDASSDSISDETPSDQTPSDPQGTYHILFHDIQADGNEYFPENNEIPALTVSSGETLAEVLLDNSLTLPSDEIAVEQCVWYTLEESGEKIPYDLTSPITADLDLYTYTYQLTLSVSQETAQSLPDMDAFNLYQYPLALLSVQSEPAALPNSDTEEEDSAEAPYLTKTITAREGQPLDPESLKIDTVDCADLVWTDLETFESIDAQELQENGLTQNYEVLVASQIAGTVTCYVLVNEQWIPLTTLTAHAPDKNNPSGQKNRYYITDAELEEIYRDYGFSSDKMKDPKNNHIFPHTDSNSTNTIWADADPWPVDGTYHVPLTSYASRISYLYYLPENCSGNATYFESSKNVEDTAMKKANTFYTVTVSDPTDLIYSESTLPKEQLVFQGESLEVTLPQTKGVTWNVTNAKTQESLTLSSKENAETNTITFTIDHIQCPIAFTASTGQKLVHCYAAIDGAWELVKTAEVSGEEQFGSQTRFYITASRLKSIYETYGLSFPEISSTENLSFPHTDSNGPDKIWADVSLLERDNDYAIPLGDTTTNCSYYNLYYLPNNTESFSSKSLTGTGGDDLRNSNTFYSVTVEDPQGLLDDSQLPNTRYVLNNHNYSVTLPWKEDLTWTASNSDTNAIIPITSTVDEAKQTITLSMKAVSCPMRLTAVKSNMQIQYSAGISPSLITIENTAPGNQQILKDGTIGGSATYSAALPNTTYKILSPDQETTESRLLTTKGKQHILYRFVGWKVEHSTYILKPGETIEPWEQTVYDVDHTGTISLVAKWSPYTQIAEKDRHISVNFFLNLNCEIMDNQEDGFQPQPQENFTTSVFSTVMKNTENASNTEQALINTATKDNASATDEEIRKLAETPVRGYSLSAFPSDEEIFEELRAQNAKIYVNGKESTAVSSEDLTTENFRIRWYVVKYQNSDGWHIDGILVAKEANITVTKTFVGDAEAIETVKNSGYSIQVTHQDVAANGGEATDYQLTLKPAAEEKGKNQIGYTEYDSATDTYTWVLNGRQKRQYTFKEQKYQLSRSSWSTSSHYRIVNSETNDTNQWLPYSDTSDVSVIAQAYPKDVSYQAYQTVRFRNTYTNIGFLNLFKVDATSGNGMANVSFRISKRGTDDKYQPLPLYQKAKESQYSYQKDNTYTTNSSGMICTDSRGHLNIKLEPGTYRLEETRFPEGYTGASSIEFTVNGKGTIDNTIDITAPDGVPSPAHGWASLTADSAGNDTTLTVRNQSKLLTTVTAQKIWDSTPESAQQPVTVELWCNGAKVSGNYTAVLNKENDWIHQWHNLPLFVDGKLANYQLRETKIGNEVYDATADAGDGYVNYHVTYDSIQYREGDIGTYRGEGTWTDSEGNTHYANQALLNIHNRTTKTIFSFQKTDLNGNPLPGAVFNLFDDAACTRWVATATSDQNGYVTFAPLPSGQTYYLKERSAPEGYLLSTEVYQANVLEDGSAVIQKSNGTIVTKIQNTPLYVLPTTGGLGSVPWTLSGTLLLCTGATLWFRRRKQNE